MFAFDLTEWYGQYHVILKIIGQCDIKTHYDIADKNNNSKIWRSRQTLSLVSLLVLSRLV